VHHSHRTWLFASDCQITPRLELLAGISNPTDPHYQNAQAGPEPACGRTCYVESG